MKRPSATGIFTVVAVVFLYAPVAVVAVFAFNGSGRLSFPVDSLSLKWFKKLFADPAFSAAFRTSLEVATVTAIIAGVVGALAAFAFTRMSSRTLSVVEVASRLPVMIPPLMLGVALLTAMDYADVVPDLKSVTLGHIIYVIPFVVIIVVARLRTLDPEIELAARDLGAGGLETIRRITLPIMLPAMIGAGAIAFAFSFDELLITTFTSGLEPTLPMYVVSRLRRTIDPSVNAVAFVMLFIPWVALGIAYLVMRRSLGAIRRGAATVDAGAEVS